ncbi:conserved hypothetical protein [Talaromyces stipitatus ATCC 10500]|uniref:Uncharacterized protein n=1 Tax=Talaromyces stipitatus (strain ATCC 10500 / CBS 375.48 / QM 6759 / NRRL 1006) TaxID=441959 RepID=B8MGN2_TALSN|nr:uncharacterized protein TSTA_018530 [Talaromyces stipitatus ATCC 10500]EED16783.1 conserved hypothetical protein [Talaromyces stipitatus ATCC 10500]
MVVIYTSTTVPINTPKDDSVRLTSAEFWKVLEHKCRNPVSFVKAITSSRVVREDHDQQTKQVTGLTRMVTIDGVEGEIEEVAILKRPVMIAFTIPSTGTSITNILSQGVEEGEMYMVSTYEWHHPEVEDGSEEHKKLMDLYWRLSSETVKHTVAVARQMKSEGKLTI